MNWRVIGSEVEPVTLGEVMEHLNIDLDDRHKDSHLNRCIMEVRERCEKVLGLSVTGKTIELAMDDFPSGEITLPVSPANAVISITYIDEDSDAQTLDSDLYVLDDFSNPSRVCLAPDASWPATSGVVNGVRVLYTTGYTLEEDGSSNTRPLPPLIRGAILVGVAYRDANREDDKGLEEALDRLLWPHQLRIPLA